MYTFTWKYWTVELRVKPVHLARTAFYPLCSVYIMLLDLRVSCATSMCHIHVYLSVYNAAVWTYTKRVYSGCVHVTGAACRI